MEIRNEIEKYSKDSTFLWAVNNIRLPKAMPWNFSDRPWQVAILEDKSKQIVTRKPTQIGMSTIFLTKMLHFADTHVCRAMITLPRQDDVSDMVNSRLLEIVNESPYLKEKMQGIDNVRTKQFGKSWLHFVEMSVPPRMIDVDWMLNDEVDLSNQEYLEHVISRLDASIYAYHHRISTPTIHGFGIDVLYNLSDMKQWIVTCAYCLHEQTIEWPDNVAHKEGKTWYICSRCGNTIHPEDIREGQWVSTGNTNSDLSGYQITQMMTPYIAPGRLWTQYQTMSRKNFYNFRLGLPYTPVTGGINRATIMQNCFISGHMKESSATTDDVYVLGCDQGDKLHVSIGRVDKNGRVHIVLVKIIQFNEGFAELARLIDKYNIKFGVIDALPNHHPAQRLVSSFNRKLYLAYFSNIDSIYRISEDERKISLNKTDCYDQVMQSIADGTLQFYGAIDSIDENEKEAVTHLCNMRRDIEEQNSRAGGVRQFHVWRAIGPDHYSDAILYMLMAAELMKSRSAKLDIISIDDILNADDEELVLDTHIGDRVSQYDDDSGVLGKRKHKKEAYLRGIHTDSKMRNNGLMQANPYRNLPAFLEYRDRNKRQT